MATNLAIDPKLLERALRVGGERTKTAAVTQALVEYVTRREQRRLVELFGSLEWDTRVRLQGRTLAPVSLFVDTSVWSLALRRDAPSDEPAVGRLREALDDLEAVFSTGLVLQELLQGFSGPRARTTIVERFASLPMLVPDRNDHVAAAQMRNECRRHGIQIGTIDVLLARLCVRHDLVMLTTDLDFSRMSPHTTLRVWAPSSQGG